MAFLLEMASQKSWIVSPNCQFHGLELASDKICSRRHEIDRLYRHVGSSGRFKPLRFRKQADVHVVSEFPFLLRSSVINSASNYSNVRVAATSETIRTPNQTILPNISKLSNRWREIQGADDWKNLLDPLDPDLKAEMIKYGEFAQLCYDAFDYDNHSEYCGSCRVNPKKLLKEYDIRYQDYEITKYLYTTSDVSVPQIFRWSDSNDPWSKSSNWIGFVAVATSRNELERLGRRDIVVAFRGTVTHTDWLADFQNSLCPSSLDPRSVGRSTHGDVRVESGFHSLYTTKNPTARYNQHSTREQLLTEIQRLTELYKDDELSISLTGHSLGAALALLGGYDLAESGLNIRPDQKAPSPAFNPHRSRSLEKVFHLQDGQQEGEEMEGKIPIAVFSFAGPRVGNSAFRERVRRLGVSVLRVVNVNDVVPKLPGLIMNEKFGFIGEWIDRVPWTYSHVGAEFAIDNNHSPYLTHPCLDPSFLHNLEAYLHLIDGYVGSGREFCDDVLSRDPALVNKSSNFLKKGLKIPSFWRQDKDKGLIKHVDGKLKFPKRDPEDIPPYQQC